MTYRRTDRRTDGLLLAVRRAVSAKMIGSDENPWVHGCSNSLVTAIHLTVSGRRMSDGLLQCSQHLLICCFRSNTTKECLTESRAHCHVNVAQFAVASRVKREESQQTTVYIDITIKHVLIKVTLSCQRHCRGTAQSLTSKKNRQKG